MAEEFHITPAQTTPTRHSMTFTRSDIAAALVRDLKARGVVVPEGRAFLYLREHDDRVKLLIEEKSDD